MISSIRGLAPFRRLLGQRRRKQKYVRDQWSLAFEPLEKRCLLSGDFALGATVLTNDALAQDRDAGFTTTIINGAVTSQYPSVGQVGDATDLYCSGTLIAPRYVLTAAHCAVDQGVTVANTQGRVRLGATTYSTSQIFVHPSYSEANFGTDLANDIAIYRLSTDVVGIAPSPIHRSIPQVGSLMTLVGFGGAGTGNTGSDGTYGTKRVGTTPIDSLSSTLIHWDFDSNSESNTAPGDSGGPSFIDVSGTLAVAGITSGGTLESAALGDQSYNTRVDVYQNWIDSIVAPTSTFSSIPYTTAGSIFTESFNSLANTGTSSILPLGFTFAESGASANTSYSVSNGASNTGDTYSFGANGSSDRAFGGQQSNALNPTLGAAIQNQTGQTLASITIGFDGEQWRLGNTARQDKLDFQYSLDATSLTSGTWIDVDSLDFIAPVTAGTIGALDGNAGLNRSTRQATLSSMSLAAGATIWLRWNDLNATGADDGLAIDNFVFSASTNVSTNTPPTIIPPSDTSTPFQTVTPPLAFTVNDLESLATNLVVTATSTNTALVPNTGLALAGTGTSRSITVTPASGQSGTTMITLSVTDGLLSTSAVFRLTVESAATGTNSLRIVSYNISSASGDGTPRAGYSTLLQAMGNEVVNGISRPVDLFALQEVLSQATTSTIIASALNSLYSTTAYVSGTLNGATSGSGTQGVVFNSQTLQLLGESAVGTVSSTGAPRQALRYQFRPVGTFGESDFFVYNAHFKAADDTESAQRRLIEAQAIRDDADGLGQNAHVIYVGDFNLFRSSESAYQELLMSGPGQALDPINRPGNWSGNTSFRDIFTQAPSATPANGLDGGGLDDRFDFQLISGELNNGTGMEYRAGSYHTFGNNGTVSVNGNIDDPSNTALPGLTNRLTILGLLRTVSDHLPVVADYTVPITASVVNRQVFYNRSTSNVFGNGSGNPVNAIDPSKLALLPGQLATFANYTSVASGLNGLIVDLLGGGTSIAASDFQFATSTMTDGESFATLDITPSVAVLPQAGFQSSTRVKLEFPDQAIRNTWLRITVLANARTNLLANDVFYFGNAVGDFGAGNTGTPVVVRTNATDTALVRQNQSNAPDSALISNPYDLNKDGRVNSIDTSLVRQNQSGSILVLFTAPSSLQIASIASLALPAERRRWRAFDSSLAELSWIA